MGKKYFSIYLCIKRTIHTNQRPRFKKTREEMHTTLGNRKKATTDSPRSVLKRKKRVEEGRTLSSRVKREHESTYLKA
jgi:hypothetical protein